MGIQSLSLSFSSSSSFSVQSGPQWLFRLFCSFRPNKKKATFFQAIRVHVDASVEKMELLIFFQCLRVKKKQHGVQWFFLGNLMTRT